MMIIFFMPINRLRELIDFLPLSNKDSLPTRYTADPRCVLEQTLKNCLFKNKTKKKKKKKKRKLLGGESNPGLPRDRRGYSPLYYQGLA